MSKNLLADTDFTDGRDKRFVHSVLIGRISKLECSEKGANVRVIMPDRLDSDGQPLITKPIPVLQISAGGKKSFAMPRIGQNALMVKLPNSTSSYAAIGFFYTSKEKPPVTDPKVDYCEWEGGHTQKHDANDDADVFLTQDFKGGWNCTVKKDVNIKTTDGAKTNIESDGDVLIKSANGNIDVKSPSGTVNIDQQNIHLTGTVTIDGNIIHNGNMTTHGVHQDNKGFHTAATRAGTEAVLANTETWKWTTKLDDASNAGQVGLDASSWAAAREVHLSMITTGSRDMTAVLEAITIGNELHLQAEADSTRFARYTVYGEAIPTGGWWTFPVRLIESNGTPPANNAATTVSIIQTTDVMAKMGELERRIAVLEARG